MALYRRFIHALIRWLARAREPREHLMSDYDRIRAELKLCDVILVEGRSVADDVVRDITCCQWTHSLLYIGRLMDIEDPDVRTLIRQHIDCEPDMALVIDTRLGDGVQVRLFSDFEREHMRLCRPKGVADKDLIQVIRYAVSRLGTDREVTELPDLAKFYFPWGLIPLNWRLALFRYNPGTHSRLMSSNLIADAFGFIQFPIMPLVKTTGRNGAQLFRRTPRLCLPKDIDLSPYFDVVKYPFIDFSNYSGENLLPWKGSGVVSGEDSSLQLHYRQKSEAPLRMVVGDSGSVESKQSPSA